MLFDVLPYAFAVGIVLFFLLLFAQVFINGPLVLSRWYRAFRNFSKRRVSKFSSLEHKLTEKALSTFGQMYMGSIHGATYDFTRDLVTFHKPRSDRFSTFTYDSLQTIYLHHVAEMQAKYPTAHPQLFKDYLFFTVLPVDIKVGNTAGGLFDPKIKRGLGNRAFMEELLRWSCEHGGKYPTNYMKQVYKHAERLIYYKVDRAKNSWK